MKIKGKRSVNANAVTAFTCNVRIGLEVSRKFHLLPILKKTPSEKEFRVFKCKTFTFATLLTIHHFACLVMLKSLNGFAFHCLTSLMQLTLTFAKQYGAL